MVAVQLYTDQTPRKYAFSPCSHLDYESADTAQNDEFKAVLIARIQNLAKKLNT